MRNLKGKKLKLIFFLYKIKIKNVLSFHQYIDKLKSRFVINAFTSEPLTANTSTDSETRTFYSTVNNQFIMRLNAKQYKLY